MGRTSQCNSSGDENTLGVVLRVGRISEFWMRMFEVPVDRSQINFRPVVIVSTEWQS